MTSLTKIIFWGVQRNNLHFKKQLPILESSRKSNVQIRGKIDKTKKISIGVEKLFPDQLHTESEVCAFGEKTASSIFLVLLQGSGHKLLLIGLRGMRGLRDANFNLQLYQQFTSLVNCMLKKTPIIFPASWKENQKPLQFSSLKWFFLWEHNSLELGKGLNKPLWHLFPGWKFTTKKSKLHFFRIHYV